MATRNVSVRLRAEVNQFKADMQAAAKASSDAAKQTETAWDKSNSHMGKLMQSAKQNERAWNTAGGVLTAVGGGIIAVGAAATKSGIEFNSLNQTATAALTSVMNSAAGASRQMDKMNEFGRGTWVMRDSIIRAQQTMTGFGIETQKVIPYMDALAETVAATTGSNQDFEELARVMGKVTSEGKITATTFREFGTRGVDAAQLIGDSMGMTAQEIRESVTDGTLDAGEALDALAEGMKTRFDGATENMRQTFSGAFANVYAGFRDLSASLAEPLVSKEGGGLAVDGLNALADSLGQLRDVSEQIPGPVKIAVGAVSGIAAVASLAAGGFLLLAPRIVETQTAFRTLAGQDDLIGKTAQGLGKMGPAMQGIIRAGAAVTLIGSMGVAVAGIVDRRQLEKMASSTRDVSAALAGLAESEDSLDRLFRLKDGSNLTGDIDSLGAALDRTFNRSASQKFNDWAENIVQATTPIRGSTGMVADQLALLDEEMARLVESGNQAEAARLFKIMQEESGLSADEMHRLNILVPEYQAALETVGGAAGGAADGVATLSDQAVEAQEQLDEMYDKLYESSRGFVDFAEKATDADVSMREWIKSMEEQVEAQGKMNDNLLTLIERGAPQELTDFFRDLGVEGATRLNELANASEDEFGRVVGAFEDSTQAAAEFAGEVTQIPDINLEADDTTLRSQLWFAKEELEKLGEMEPSPTTDLQIKLLEEKIRLAEDQLGDLDSTEAHPLVGVSGADESRGKVEDLHEALVSVPEDVQSKVDVDDAPARSTMERLWTWIRGKTIFFKTDEQKAQNTPSDTGSGSSGRFSRGGSVRGPGTGTSDDILARLSNGEHVLTAEEVRRMGGHAEVYRWRNSVMQGDIPAFAGGGAVGSAQRGLAAAERELERLQRQGRKTTAEDRQREAAQKRVERARDAVRRAEEAEAQRERVAGLQTSLRTDVRRGSVRDQVTGSLSGGYSAVDRLFGLGQNEDLSRSSRNTATASARKFESDLKRLYGQAERLDEKLKDAQDKASELEGIQRSVASGLLSDRGVDMGDYMNFSGGQWTTHTGVAGATRRMSADVGRMKEFADKLGKLMKAGIPGAILQEIAGAGVDEGIALADAFLNASSSEQASYIGTWTEYEKQANRIGNIVTGGFYDGGVDAARGVVSGLESQQKSVEAQIARLAKSMEDTLKSVLGIRSPSRVMAELGAFSAEGLVQGILSGRGSVANAAKLLADSAVPDLMLRLDAPIMDSDAATGQRAMQDMSDVTLTAMQNMRAAVTSGWESMLTDTRTAQQGMLTDTQVKQFSMRDITATQQEQMRAIVLGKQTESRTAVTTEQETMRRVMADKQTQMRDKNRTEFESMRLTTGEKLTSMRTAGDTTMTGFRGDYDGHMGVMKRLNREGHQNMEDVSDASFRGIRSGMDAQMREARPELGGNMNNLIGVLDKFTKSVNAAFGDVGVKLDSPNRLSFHTGGVMPGYTPGRDVHSFYSPTAGSLYLSGGEAIMRPEFTRAVGGEQGVKELNDAARRGDSNHLDQAMHFANGGVMPSSAPMKGVNAFSDSGVWRGLWSIVKGAFPQSRLTSAYRPGSRTAGSGNRSYHSRGMAVDICGAYRMDTGMMGSIGNWLVDNFRGSNEIIYSPLNGRQIHNGRNHMYSGVTRSNHWDHVHWGNSSVPGGATGGAPGQWDGDTWIPHPFLDKAGVTPGADLEKAYAQAAKKQLDSIIKKHSQQLGDNQFSQQLGKGVMEATRKGLTSKASDYGKLMGDGGVPGAANGPVKQMAREVLEKMGWGDQWADLDWLVQKESSWNPNAQNPTSTAYGLFQFLNGTWGSVGAKKTSDPLGQIQAGVKYIQQRYGDVRGARRFWERNNWYADGTDKAKSGWAVVGEEGPELINLGGGERIESNPQTRKALAANRTFLPSQGGGVDATQIAKVVAVELAKRPQNVVNVDSTSHTETGIARKVSSRIAEDTSLYLTGV